MTVLHHAEKAGFNPRMAAQDAFGEGSTVESTSRQLIALPTLVLSLSATGFARLPPEEIANSPPGDVRNRVQRFRRSLAAPARRSGPLRGCFSPARLASIDRGRSS